MTPATSAPATTKPAETKPTKELAGPGGQVTIDVKAGEKAGA